MAKSNSLNPANRPLTVEAWVKPGKPDGVIVARGGQAHGYVLRLDNGRPVFALRVTSDIQAVRADRSVETGKWVHLAGVLTPDKKLKIYVDGQHAGTADTPGFIASDPAEEMQVGGDEGSTVGDYRSPSSLAGIVDELKIYDGALSTEQVRADLDTTGKTNPSGSELVLYFSFDGGKARDLSGNRNHGTPKTFEPSPGKYDYGARFTGGGSPAFYKVDWRWSRHVPLHARAMVLADDTLFVAGPPDLVNEREAARNYGAPQMQRKLRRQDAAWHGAEGAVLRAVSARNGARQAQYELETLPVWDGMAAADGRLYLSGRGGRVICFGGRKTAAAE